MNTIKQTASIVALVAATAAAPVVAQTVTAGTQADADVTVNSDVNAEAQVAATGETALEHQAEEAGNAIAEAAEETGDVFQTGAEQAGEAVAEAGDTLKREADEAGEAVAEAGAKMEREVEETVAEAEAEAAHEVEQAEMAEADLDVEGSVEGQIVMQDEDTILVRDFLGASVFGPEGDRIGEIDDMIISMQGEVEGVVIGVGGFLGIGEKDVALKMDQIQVRQTEDGRAPQLITDATREALENAEEFVTVATVRAEQELSLPAAGTGVEGDATVRMTE